MDAVNGGNRMVNMFSSNVRSSDRTLAHSHDSLDDHHYGQDVDRLSALQEQNPFNRMKIYMDINGENAVFHGGTDVGWED